MNGIVSEWIEKAEGNFWTAEREARARKTPNYDAVCFHAQQCAEKYLKAFLICHQVPFRPIHDLEVLLGLIVPTRPDFEVIRDALLLLNDYAVDIRYPGEFATKDEACAAVKAMSGNCEQLPYQHSLQNPDLFKRRREMKSTWTIVGSILAMLLLALAVGPGQAQGPQPPGESVQPQGNTGIQAALVGTAFTYQGQLKQSGSPVNGNCDFQFSLWTASSGGGQIAPTQTRSDVPVSNGLFTIPDLDFGDGVFQGTVCYLEIAVRCPAGSGSYTPLAPRQALTAIPYALSLRPGAQVVGPVTASPYAVVYARNTDTSGTAYGVYGESASAAGSGVHGEAPILGVFGRATATDQTTYGVYGESRSPYGQGVAGWALATSGHNYGVYGHSYSTDGTGVYGLAGATSGETYGVYGRSASPAGYGGYFVNNSADGVALYASGSGSGRNKATLRVDNTETSGGMAAYFTNNSNYHTAHFYNADADGGVLYLQNANTGWPYAYGDFITAQNSSENNALFRVLGTGEVRSDVGFNTPAADLAELLPAAPGLEPGDVLVVGADGKLARSTQAYQPTVVGVYSTRPGFVGGQPVEGELEGHIPLAVVGVVPVKVSAENGPIRPGDLLVASATPGHAMRAGLNPPQGTVIGKALEGLAEGTGVIQMLVVLQ